MPVKPDLTIDVPAELGRVHFIGIGGSGMSGIAHMMLDAGLEVSGSDRDETPYLQRLRDRGARIHVGHAAENLGDADTIVFTSAIWPENPEYVLAQQKGLVQLHRSQALHWLSRERRVVSVAGAHGKSTTTGMIVTLLRETRQDPSFVNGAVIQSLKTSSASGEGELFVLEADESDGSFLLYSTAAAVITNVDPVHLDHYGSREGYLDAFRTFAAQAREVIVAGEGAELDAVLADVADGRSDGPRVVRVGESADADYRVTDIVAAQHVEFTITHDGAAHPARIDVAGRHNALNAAVAVATLVELGQPIGPAIAALTAFGGTKRRFEFKGEVRGVTVYDDYAHEPAEAAAAVAGARSVVGEGRVIAIHQPHLYSRTQMFSGEFAKAYERNADYTIVLGVDGAREDPIPGVSGQLVVDGFDDKSKVALIEDWAQAAEHLAGIAREGDLVMTLSCGTVYQLVPQLLEALERRA
ncbi:UDP-N-acetylmuramate--L-alanine ligase [Schumannella sp. 10F1B-5-1]|uniref:UDP-N-acetylmuramate--L-alanine ligase n=1 Tax=Schumannella sp. 10F1B-5-1 TaxID=2590780 RepID=UPI00113103C8|nr:UDP-N-acetylmuramate--L-alanine ligase [Schumannella sp. 10F1B-5-1]TPW73808.1 UDP-N-acetylmuramate--L-alanine ligase [Schumannella sp. 10F1B-5-1]